MNEPSEYRELFVAEARENLQALSDGALQFERGEGAREAVDGLFRAAHTLKGMSAMMGFDGLTRLCHALEDVLDTLRSGSRASSPELADDLLASVDAMSRMLADIDGGGDGGPPDPGLLARFQGPPAPEAPAPAEPASAESAAAPAGLFPQDAPSRLAVAGALAQGRPVLRLAVTLDAACAFKGVRALLVSKALERQARVVARWPEGKAFENGEFGSAFVLWTAGGPLPSEQQAAVLKVLEVSGVESEALDPGAWPALEAPSAGDATAALFQAPEAALEAPAQAPEAPGQDRGLDGEIDAFDGSSLSSAVAMHPTVRVHVARLDKIMDLVGELVTAKIRLAQIGRSSAVRDLGDALIQVDHIVGELQREVTAARMVPMDQMFSRFPRLVRDLGRSMGKPIDLVLEGREIELDRSILEEIGEALVHLLRNAADHGIEAPQARAAAGKPAVGTIRLEARRDKNYVVISVEDDGAGLDTGRIREVAVARGLVGADEARLLTEEQALAFIFSPGFSTASSVTSVSGRGVGIDAVRSRAEALGGGLRVENFPGHGARFRIRVPLTLAIIRALRVRVAHESYMVPVANVLEAVEYSAADVSGGPGAWMVPLRDEFLSLYHLDELLGLERGRGAGGQGLFTVLVLEAAQRRVGLVVDEVLGQQEIAIKNLGRRLKAVRGFGGVTLLGDGSVCLILDLPSLLGL